MKDFEELGIQYLYDDTGNKIGVFMNIKTFDELIEQIEDLYLAIRAQKILESETEFISQEEVEKTLE